MEKRVGILFHKRLLLLLLLLLLLSLLRTRQHKTFTYAQTNIHTQTHFVQS